MAFSLEKNYRSCCDSVTVTLCNQPSEEHKPFWKWLSFCIPTQCEGFSSSTASIHAILFLNCSHSASREVVSSIPELSFEWRLNVKNVFMCLLTDLQSQILSSHLILVLLNYELFRQILLQTNPILHLGLANVFSHSMTLDFLNAALWNTSFHSSKPMFKFSAYTSGVTHNGCVTQS